MDPANDLQKEQAAADELWRHHNPTSTPMWRFLESVNKKYNLKLKDYPTLYQWSIDNIAAFWEEVWLFTGIVASKEYDQVVNQDAAMYPRPIFFSGAYLNFAQNLLYPPVDLDSTSIAVIAATETQRESVTWKDLRVRVEACQLSLRSLGVKVSDRVAGYLGNHINAIVAMLATTSLGAVWTAISPDSGVDMVVDRLKQIEPKLLFADDGQFYNGKRHSVCSKVGRIVNTIPSIETVIVLEVVSESLEMLKQEVHTAQVLTYAGFYYLGQNEGQAFEFVQLPADHPVYILYSSGTTGAPKCIVHGAIGTLLQHKKEHVLHCSIQPGQRFFYYTTTTWMMWHWLVSGLASAATLVLYDGSPMRYRAAEDSDGATATTYESVPDEFAMPRLIDELSINHFGTSAKYLSLLEQRDLSPRDNGLSLHSLDAIYNTASPLAPSTFRYIYRKFGPAILLGSITGGTDIISLFGAACPLLPVHAGEIQAAGLGMAIRAWDDEGNDVTDSGNAGDLVCVKPFPSQPVAFWGPGGVKRYRSSYFERFPKVWHHGDYVQFSPDTMGFKMLGRSDGVLNPAGIRFGSAEIYNVLLKHFAGKVEDALCIGRKRENEHDEVVVLFLKMEQGQSLTGELVKEIKSKVREDLSARHVPEIIDECPDIPVTVNGKKIEGAIKQIISRSTVKTSASVANVECLEFYKKWAVTH